MSYIELLKDPRWQRKRLEVMQRDDFSCVACWSTTKTLNVHHTRYRKGAMPWDYDASELVTMCQDCHGEYEAAKRSLLETISTILDTTAIKRIAAYAKAVRAAHCTSDGKGQSFVMHGTAEWFAFSDILRRSLSEPNGAEVYVPFIAEETDNRCAARAQAELAALGTEE